MPRPLLSQLDFWANFEARVLNVVSLALNILQAKNKSLSDMVEDDLNYELYFCMLEAVRELGGAASGIESPPAYDCINQPLEDEELLDIRRRKRPDFQWSIIDHLEPNPRKSARRFYIECKRLGVPTESKWVFNKNYINHGVCRFIDPQWGYGKAVSSGAMVGYIQNMELEVVLSEVNSEAEENSISQIVLSSEGWIEKGVSRLDQEINRPKVPPESFQLRHLWVDIRGDRLDKEVANFE